MRRHIFLSAVAALLVSVVATHRGQAQTLAWTYQLTARAGHQAPFLESLAAHAEWRRQQDDPWEWQVYEIIGGNNIGDFVARSGGHQWADLDAYDGGFGPTAGEHFGTNVLPHLENVTGRISTADTVNVHWPEQDPGFTLFQVIRFNLKPDKEQQFFQTVGKFHTALRENNFPGYYTFVTSVIGGDGPVVDLVLPFTNWAAMAPPERTMEQLMFQAYGPAEAMQIFSAFADTYTSTTSAVLRLRPDLSVTSGM